jgi:hypothetical protein
MVEIGREDHFEGLALKRTPSAARSAQPLGRSSCKAVADSSCQAWGMDQMLKGHPSRATKDADLIFKRGRIRGIEVWREYAERHTWVYIRIFDRCLRSETWIRLESYHATIMAAAVLD